jgi:hypothetical protein
MVTAAEKTSLAGVQPWVYASGAMKPGVPHCEDENWRTSGAGILEELHVFVAVVVVQICGKRCHRSGNCSAL